MRCTVADPMLGVIYSGAQLSKITAEGGLEAPRPF